MCETEQGALSPDRNAMPPGDGRETKTSPAHLRTEEVFQSAFLPHR